MRGKLKRLALALALLLAPAAVWPEYLLWLGYLLAAAGMLIGCGVAVVGILAACGGLGELLTRVVVWIWSGKWGR